MPSKMPVSEACAEMPRYKSHKEVWALKIANITMLDGGAARIIPSDRRYAPFDVDPTWCEKRYDGDANDLGYYVVYDDGYKSWSPSKAFEEGYTLIER